MKKFFVFLLVLMLGCLLLLTISSKTFSNVNLGRASTTQTPNLSVEGNVVSVSDINGQGVDLISTAAVYNAAASIHDGFSIKISEIAWDADNANGVMIYVGPTANGTVVNTAPDGLALYVNKSGSVYMWTNIKNGFNPNTHPFGQYTDMYAAQTDYLPDNVGSFYYSILPLDAGYSQYGVFVTENVPVVGTDTPFYTYNTTATQIYSGSWVDYTQTVRAIFNKAAEDSETYNFSFQIWADGALDWGSGITTIPSAGSLSYKVESIDLPSVPVTSSLGLYSTSLTPMLNISSDNTVSVTDIPGQAAATSDLISTAAVYNADASIHDGFSIKISEIAWDTDNANGIMIYVGPTANGTVRTGEPDGLALYVNKSGNAYMWTSVHNAYNPDTHGYGKWTDMFASQTDVLPDNVGSFYYSILPAGGEYHVYVTENKPVVGTDTPLYSYNTTATQIYDGSWVSYDHAVRALFNEAADDSKTYNFSFQIWADGALSWGDGITAIPSAGSLSYKVESIELPSAPSAVSCTGHQVILSSGKIGMTFFMDLSHLSESEKDACYMEFEINGETRRVNYDSGFMNDSGKYGFTAYVSSIQMNEPIRAAFHNGVETSVLAPYSVQEYVDYIQANEGSYDSKTIALVRALADYGYYAQIYLSEVNGWTIGDKYAASALYGEAPVYDYGSIQSEIAAAGKTFSKSIDGTTITNVTYRLLFDSETAIDVFFTSPTAVTASATFNGTVFNAEQVGSRYRIRITGIRAQQLGEMITITGNAGSDFAVNVSGLSYVYSILNGNNADAKNAVSAFYDYYKAAVSLVS